MKKQFVATAVLFVVGLLALPAHGQGPTIRVNVPFQFTVGDKTYPSGKYALSAIEEDVLLLEKDGRWRIGLFGVNHVIGRNKPAQVRFQCYDQQCFLSQVWISGLDDGFETRRSRMEEEVAARTTGKYVALMGTAPQR
jgi:hypothetical protein